jgi:hypothetical protein
VVRAVKDEVQAHRLLPPLVPVRDYVADVERHHHAAAGTQNAAELGERGRQIGGRQVHDRVEAHDARP